jgi:hypothetical protein
MAFVDENQFELTTEDKSDYLGYSGWYLVKALPTEPNCSLF